MMLPFTLQTFTFPLWQIVAGYKRGCII